MGFRFHKTITLFPGLRMNLGANGVSFSAGPRGASVTFGGNGVHGNVGIPGTGISYRTRLDGGGDAQRPSESPQSPASVSNRRSAPLPKEASPPPPTTAKILDDGTVQICALDGAPVSPEERNDALRRNAPAILSMLRKRVEDLDAWRARVLSPHLSTPAPRTEAGPFFPEPFSLPKPERPDEGRIRSLAPWLGGAERAEERLWSEMEAHRAALAEWTAAEAEHAKEQRKARVEHERWAAGDPQAIIERFERRLATVPWPRPTSVSFQFDADALRLDVDLPEIEHMPGDKATVDETRFRIVMTESAKTELAEAYAQHVHSIGFRVAGEAFAVGRGTKMVIVSGFSQRRSKATARVEDEYLFSVRLDRARWTSIDFGRLDNIDPVSAIERFDLRRDMTSDRTFRPITPFE